ncbi:MAG: hypothetical protein JW864_02615 [Spirochaetes bacterium]|nr:hypothetical protein [Spirochaetota bacterium]
MRNFPVGKLFIILSHKFDINIDSSGFGNFILSGDASQIQAKGLIFDNEFIWEDKTEHKNIISIEYREILNTDSAAPDEKECNLLLTVNGKRVEWFRSICDSKEPLLVTIAGTLGYSRLNKDNDDYYINNENKSIVNLHTISTDAI